MANKDIEKPKPDSEADKLPAKPVKPQSKSETSMSHKASILKERIGR